MIRSKKTVTPAQALVRLEELCVRAERCESELRRKLSLWAISSADSDAIITSLRDRRFLDERRFAASFVRDKYRFSKWGVRQIVRALKQKKIPQNCIDEALKEIDFDQYTQILTSILHHKARNLHHPLEFDDRNRLFRFALSRGFEPDLALRIIKSIHQS